MNKAIREKLTALRKSCVADYTIDSISHVSSGEIQASFGRHLWNAEVRKLLYQWLDEVDFSQKKQQLFCGEKINFTENKPALHTALRDLDYNPIYVDGLDVAQQIKQSHHKMAILSDAIREGELQAVLGQPITDIVHIGMGGSVFGTQLCYESLLQYRSSGIRIHFISYMDLTVIEDVLKQLRPEATLFFLASKSFSTEEMLSQAEVAKNWLQSAGLMVENHVMAATSRDDLARQWGVKQDYILPMWPWIGGRFSLWSAVSFSLIVAIGIDAFYELLRGANAMDRHFQLADYHDNIPVQLACLSAWYTDICQYTTHAIIPYSARMLTLPTFLQQLHMESLGKNHRLSGYANPYLACPVLYGDIGTRSQHALSQYFMQAPTRTPLDIIVVKDAQNDSQKRLLAHAQAQSDVLWHGYHNESMPYKSIKPYNPHTVIEMNHINPASLGSLLAMYEHKVFTLGVLYNINAFDQWAVERGKIIARQYYDDMNVEKVNEVAHEF